MPNPHLLFCPYLPLGQTSGPIDKPIEFADWEIGPLRLFEDRWADSEFKSQATTLLDKYNGTDPIILCKKGEQLDGRRPCAYELQALELALAFGFLDSNPRKESNDEEVGGAIVTTDSAELHLWSINLQNGGIQIPPSGYLAKTIIHGKVKDPRLDIKPPLDLPIVNYPRIPDPLVLTGIYKTVLASLRSPDTELEARNVRVAVEWLAKAWHNTTVVHDPERLVFLKIAFEAITGEGESRKSASKLRQTFEGLPAVTENDPDFLAEFLIWSPKEKPVHTWVSRHCKTHNQLTDIEAWFMAFSDVRNAIIHEGIPPALAYPSSPTDPEKIREIYYGDFFSTATYLLCSAIKVLLCKRGYKDAWFPHCLRTIGDSIDIDR